MTASDLAARLGCVLEGPDAEILGAAPLESAGASDLSFAVSSRFFEAASRSGAGCVIAPAGYRPQPGQSVLRSESPRALFGRALTLLFTAPPPRPGVHASAFVAPGAVVSATAEIGPMTTIGANAFIGPETRIGAGCHVGANTRIGAACTLYAAVTIYDNVRLGDRVVLHSGCVIGADGFGFAPEGGRWAKFPQVGRVEIGDDVEIGAQSCVDRAALGVTSIGEGTKLDNLVHVGHNCRIGAHVVVAAQTGFSGGVVVGDHAIIGGQVGVGDQARIEAGVVLGSGSGVLTSKIVRSGGGPLWGTPARPLKQYLSQLAALARLPELKARVRSLEARLADIEKKWL